MHDEREQLLVAALAASDRERSRIAADLHGGVVQGLSGASYTLTAEAARVSAAGHQDIADALHGLAIDLRRSVRELRSLIVTITPPGLRRQPLLASLKDLVAPLEDRGIDVRVTAAVEGDVDQAVVDLVLRTAQEAVRNVRPAAATSSTRSWTPSGCAPSDRSATPSSRSGGSTAATSDAAGCPSRPCAGATPTRLTVRSCRSDTLVASQSAGRERGRRAHHDRRTAPDG